MPTIPSGNVPSGLFQPIDINGDPFPGGKLATFLAGTSTPAPIYLDQQRVTVAANPVVLNSAGYAVLYFDNVNYKFQFSDADDVVQWTIDGIQDVGQIQINQLGNTLAGGAKAVASGYIVLVTDNLVTVNSTALNPTEVTLHLANLDRLPLTIKNVGTNQVNIFAAVGDTIDGVAAAYPIPASVSPDFPSVFMVPDGTTGWHILASHKVP